MKKVVAWVLPRASHPVPAPGDEAETLFIGGRRMGEVPPTCLGPAPLGSFDTPASAQNQVPILTLEP